MEIYLSYLMMSVFYVHVFKENVKIIFWSINEDEYESGEDLTINVIYL